jgi:hypothetical protein
MPSPGLSCSSSGSPRPSPATSVPRNRNPRRSPVNGGARCPPVRSPHPKNATSHRHRHIHTRCGCAVPRTANGIRAAPGGPPPFRSMTHYRAVTTAGRGLAPQLKSSTDLSNTAARRRPGRGHRRRHHALPGHGRHARLRRRDARHAGGKQRVLPAAAGARDLRDHIRLDHHDQLVPERG